MTMSDGLERSGRLASDALRRLIFLYQDGIVLASTLRAFDALGLLRLSTSLAPVLVLRPNLSARGFAHLRVGMRTLEQAGWLAEAPGLTAETTRLSWSLAGRSALEVRDDYILVGQFLALFDSPEADAWSEPWDDEKATAFSALADRARRGWGRSPDQLIGDHLNGALSTPLLLRLWAQGELDHQAPSVNGPEQSLLRSLGWLTEDARWSSQGQERLAIVPHLGLTASYLPMLSRLPDMYAGAVGPRAIGSGRESHVQRELNIRASTVAHGRYFADADEAIRPVFEAAPLVAQPSFVIDIGCGDGAWLARVASLVRDRTLRGRHLDSFPLRLVGVDSAPAAIERASAALQARGVEALLVQGDVGDPQSLARALAGHGLDLADALHLRGFVDHDRTFIGAPAQDIAAPHSSGAFIGPDGETLAPEAVEADLTRHLAQWEPYLRRHGMIALEAHYVPPAVAARRQGALHSIAFDAYHGYSRQYPVERGAYVEAVRRAGLRPAAAGGRCYPSSRPFVAVSLNVLRSARDIAFGTSGAPGSIGAAPRGETRSDGAALHRLLYRDGDIRHVRPWCAPATQALVGRAMSLLEAKVEGLPDGGVLRVCDYGTGTGLAAIELCKAMGERHFPAKLAARRGALELICLDIESDWFNQGREHLKGLDGVEFHALTDPQGRFRPLAEVLQGRAVDVVLSSMVFHLIRPAALMRLADGLSMVLAPDGVLLWNAPDIGPATPWSILFHDPNRALRARWEAMLRGAVPPATPSQRDALAQAPRDDDGGRRIDTLRAGRRIMKMPNDADEVHAILARRLDGRIASSAHEMTAAEVAAVLHVPANHREYLPEIGMDALRLQVIDELMSNHILPGLLQGPAGTGLGLSVHWTSGAYHRRSAC